MNNKKPTKATQKYINLLDDYKVFINNKCIYFNYMYVCIAFEKKKFQSIKLVDCYGKLVKETYTGL